MLRTTTPYLFVDLKLGEVQKIIAQRWKDLPEEERKVSALHCLTQFSTDDGVG